MNRVTKVILAVSLTVIVASFGFIGGFVTSRLIPADSFTGAVSNAIGASGESTAAARVDEVLSLMKDRALIVPTDTSATAGSVQGLLSSMGDKYATYFDPKEYKAFNEDSMGSFGGIGVVLGDKAKTTYVTTVYPGTPAAKAGLKPGDVFLTINGDRRLNWQSDQVVKRVRGDVGTVVKLTMFRPSTAKGAKSLVLDLRDNPGGLLDQAVDVSSLFIPSGVIVRVDERNKPEEALTAKGDKLTNLPLVVLIDANSASASEITGGALQDYGRAKLVGTTSYGKGSVQTVEQLKDGGAVKFTIAHYLTPKRRVINGIGLTPDVLVKMDPMKQLNRKTDVQLQRALSLATSEGGN